MSSTVDTKNDVKKMGYLKKQKTMKKKLFVLREESDNGPARLEYYDSEKKYVCGRPKRSIHLHNCFSINAKSDSKHKYAIVLYTREDCFAVICENEADQMEWLSAMISLRNYQTRESSACPLYEYIWPVTVKSKGLGNSKHLVPGQYRLCLMPNEVSFIRPNKDTPDLVLPLACIRKCGHTGCFFYLEPGRMASTGSGVLWMQVEDDVIARNMHEAIISFMSSVSTSRPRRHTVSDKTKPSSSSSKSHGSHSSQAASVIRSKTMSAADHPTRWRGSQSPNKGLTGVNTLRPTTTSDIGLFSINLPLSSEHGHRSRTNSMDSSFSRNTNSFSADELDSPLEEQAASSSTPTSSSSPYVKVDHARDFGLSPVSARQSSSQEASDDYLAVDSANKSAKSDVYVDMEMSKAHTNISESLLSTRPRNLDHVGRSRVASEDGYMDMALNVSKEDSNVVSDEGSIDSGVRLDCSRTAPKETSPGSATPSQDHLDINEYIIMNTGVTEESSYIDMSRSSSVAASPALSSSSSLHEVAVDGHHLPVSVGSRSSSVTEQDEYFEVGPEPKGHGSVAHTGISPRLGQMIRPDRVCSYLADENTEQIPFRSSSLGSRSQLMHSRWLTESHLDMKKGQDGSASGDRASSTPMLSRGVGGRTQWRSIAEGDLTGPRGGSSKELLEEKDFLMEMNFNHRHRQAKEHEYEEVRPRSSSGGSHDLHTRTASSGSQERRRAGSFGHPERLSKIASLARANVHQRQRPDGGHGQRQRLATVCCQEPFHKRTSSFGTAVSDMRPRSSSHGNARYVDMSGRLHNSSSHASSHDSLPYLNKRGSQESVRSTAGEYLDMKPRGTAFKSADRSEYRPQCSQSTDGDYLDMDRGRSGDEPLSADRQGQRSPEGHVERSKNRTKRGSTSSRVSFSSSESLTSNTSQSSEGRGMDRSVASQTAHDGKWKRTPRSAEKESKPKTVTLDDSYVLYSPGDSRQPSPLSAFCGASLDKVSSPIRAADAESPLPGMCRRPAAAKTDSKHDYINVHYDDPASGKENPASGKENPASGKENPPSFGNTSTEGGRAGRESQPRDGDSGGQLTDQSAGAWRAGSSQPEGRSPGPAESDYLLITPGKPTTPAPLPGLQPVVSPIRDEASADRSEAPTVTPLAQCPGDDYIVIDGSNSGTADVEDCSPTNPPRGQAGSASKSDSAQNNTDKDGTQPSRSAEVNYATLDLQAAGEDGNGECSARPRHTGSGSAAAGDCLQGVPLQYAQIDFKKSEQLRKNSADKKTPAPFNI